MSKEPAQTEVATTIYVDYRIVGDWHLFTSEQVRGLYVAHADRRMAYEAICPTIEKLMAENECVEIKVRPALSFDAFLDQLRSHLRVPEIIPGKPHAFILTAGI